MASSDASDRQIQSLEHEASDWEDRESIESTSGDLDRHDTSVQRSLNQESKGLLNKPRRSSSSNTNHDIDVETTALNAPEDVAAKAPRKDVTWRSLPHKNQLLILTFARLAEPLFQNSLSSYMFFMLQSFDPSLNDSAISSQAGILTGAFTAAQCITAVFWGRLADQPFMGRKNIILIGLVGSFFSSIAFGFAKSFWAAILFRTLGGALNGNVGVMRTMISELIKEKKYQPKAFLILPATFNFGVMVGPLFGGWLQSPVELYPSVFGPGSRLGGANGVQWMTDYPYALPNLVNAFFFLFSIVLVVLGLQETLIDRANRTDRGLEIGYWLKNVLRGRFKSTTTHEYAPLDSSVELSSQTAHRSKPSTASSISTKRRPKLAYRRIFTSNLIFTMLAHGLLHIHLAAFNNLWFLFLSTPRFDSSHPEPPFRKSQNLPFSFTGGLGLPPPTIGLAIGIIGFVGLLFQLGVYSWITFRLGIVLTHRLALALTFPLVYVLIPYLVVLPTRSIAPAPADGPWIWIAISVLLVLQTFGRTFVLPITQILVNNASPHPSVLGAVHGVGQSVSSGCRTLGPVIWSSLYGVGLDKGAVGIAWWVLGAEAVATAAASWLLREGTGHEILLDGDDEE